MCLLYQKWCSYARRANIMVKIARNPIFATKKLPKLWFFIKKQAKPLIFHGFPCQNFPTVNPSSRHAYYGYPQSPGTLSNRIFMMLNVVGRGVSGESVFFLRETTFLTPEHHIWQDSKVDPASKASKPKNSRRSLSWPYADYLGGWVQGFAVNSDITRPYNIGTAERAPRVFRFLRL